VLATLIGSADKATMHYFILIVALLLDPASVLLLLAGRIGASNDQHPRISLYELVVRIVLDINLLHRFAAPQGRSPGCD